MNKKELKALVRSTGIKHSVYHKFCRWAEKQFGKEWEDPKVFSGHEVMEKVEAYAKKNPQISIAHCDDDMFSGSLLVVIPHQEMGNTVLFIPQLTYRTNRFFLYPNHQKSLIKALTENTHMDLITRLKNKKRK